VTVVSPMHPLKTADLNLRAKNSSLKAKAWGVVEAEEDIVIREAVRGEGGGCMGGC
jgi:hypothetical protein